MDTHIKVIGWLNIVMGGLMALAGVVVMLVMGGIASFVNLSDQTSDAQIAAPILGGIGGIVFLVLVVLSLPSIFAGVGLLRMAPWGRILGIVVSALHLLNVPVGTVLGAYGLWALTNNETEALFRRHEYLQQQVRY